MVHFAFDVVFAVPLLLAPEWLLPRLGWLFVDPVTSRLVGAALMGIGVQSLLGRNAGIETFRAMLNLKIIWSASATFGLGLALLRGGPPVAGLFLLVPAPHPSSWRTFRRYWLYWLSGIWAMSRSSWPPSMKPMCRAASSMQPILRPWRVSMAAMNWLASSRL